MVTFLSLMEAFGHVPKKVTPAFLSRCPLILGGENSALHRPSPLTELDNVEVMKLWDLVGDRRSAAFEQRAGCLRARQLDAALPLLGKLQPLMRQLFVAPLAFLVPAVRELSVLDRVRAGLLCLRLTPDQAIAGCEEIHCHGNLTFHL